MEQKIAGLDGQTLIALGVISWLILKHFICDFVLQTSYQAQYKGYYGHPAGLMHVAIHGVGSTPLFALILVAPSLAPALVGVVILLEMAVHYHIDWLKQGLVERMGWTPDGAAFWIALGGDQFLHYATYVAMTVTLAVVVAA